MSFKSIAGTILLLIIAATACVHEPSISYNDIEQRSLKAWIDKYHPELLNNYQEEGGYYVEVLDRGIQDSLPITGKDIWVWFDLTARDLQGNIYETRSATIAEQLATYNAHAHYIPALRFSGKDKHTLMEGTYLATFNELNIDGEIFEVRYGTELRLYLPSSVTGSTVTGADGGYEGQYKADASKPMIVDMKIYGHVTNPVEYEGERINAYAEENGGLCTEHKATIEEEETKSIYRRYITRGDEIEDKEEIDTRPLEFYDGRWHQPVDTIEHLLVKYLYSPKSAPLLFNDISNEKYPNEGRYRAGSVYSSSDIDSRINTALVKRFGKGMTIEELPEADSLKVKTEAKIWYVGRFMDGFIFDTNIDEVKEIVYGKVDTPGEALTFNPKTPLDNDYILAWNYALPTLRYGQWAAILTASTYGYGISGKVGSHTTKTNYSDAYYDYANYYNYMNYMNNYYGNGYGNMYNNNYYGYNPYYYGYNYNLTEDDVTTTSTTSTEIPAYSPLIFQVFIEKPNNN
jgi:hypothetical protein